MEAVRRVAIVTGAGSGIGRATAKKLAEAGYAVALVGRSQEKLDKVAGEIVQAGGRALAVAADVSRVAAVEAMVARVLETFGRVDVLVNNAGWALMMPLMDTSAEQWRDTLDANLSAAFYVARCVWPVMKRQAQEVGGGAPRAGAAGAGAIGTGATSTLQGGLIINISSMASRDPFPGLGAYPVAKAGMNMLTLVLAREGSEAGIRVVGIAPGAVDTEMFRSVPGSEKMPRHLIMSPENIADVVAGIAGGTLRHCSGETIFLHAGPA